MLKPTRPVAIVASLGGGLWLLNQSLGMAGAVHSTLDPYAPWLANLFVLLLMAGVWGSGGAAGYWLWSRWRRPPVQDVSPAPRRVLKVTADRVAQELAQVEALITKVHHEARRRAWQQQVQQITAELTAQHLSLVVFGTSSAGKTSLINALIGAPVGDTAPTLGTTQTGAVHTYTLAGLEGEIRLTDTPGLQTIGLTGEEEALALAQTADLILFVTTGDLDAAEDQALRQLVRQGKRLLLILNKLDQLPPPEQTVVMTRLRQKLREIMPQAALVGLAAAPVPLKVRYWQADGTCREEEEPQAPQITDLMTQLATLLKREGRQLRLANVLAQTQSLAAGVQLAIAQAKREAGEGVIQRMQWATAGAVAVTPVPTLDWLAAAAINARMIAELHAVYDRKISRRRAQEMAKVLAKVLLQMGGVEVVTQMVGAGLKATPMAVMGIPLQAVSAAYLTRITGLSYLDWLASEQPWDRQQVAEGMKQQLQQQDQGEFVKQFVQQAIAQLRPLLSQGLSQELAPADPDSLGSPLPLLRA